MRREGSTLLVRELPAGARGDEIADLARLQRGLQRLLHEPGERARVEGAAANAIGCDAEQVGVYREMVALRLAREVAREFPATRRLLGGARFDAEAHAFVERTPSRSYTLDGYARRLPEHLRRSSDATLRAAAELARLERDVASVRAVRAPRGDTRGDKRGEQSGAVSADPVAHRTPRLEAAPGARLRRFAWDVETAYAAHERGASSGAHSGGEIRLALFRHAGRCVRLRVTRAESPLLAALLHGEPLERAVARGVDAGLGAEAIRDALARWVAARLLLAS